MKRKLICAFVFFLSSLTFYGTHIVGGELFYDYLGSDTYKVTLKVYRDCSNLGNAAYDNPAAVAVYDKDGNLITTLSLSLPPVNAIQTPPSPCYVTPTNVCVEEAIYTTIVKLPPIPGGYTFVYQRCCRSATIQNLFNPGNTGSSYFATIPDTSIAKTNNGPRFNNYPPVFLCVNYPLTFDHSATDADADSLVYYLCDAYTGASSTDPQPNPPAPPPYSPLTWVSPYSGSNPISASTPFTIDAKTGLLTGTPDMIGQWVVGVCVDEFRKGKLLGTHHRDFQFNVINCTNIPIVSIPAQSSYCSGKTVNFVNNSSGATTYHWDFGVTNTLKDTSDLVTPTYTYPDTGMYEVTLIANPRTPCSNTAKATFAVYDPIQIGFSIFNEQCKYGEGFEFGALGNLTKKAVYSWDFDQKATPQLSSAKNPPTVIYSELGTYVVKLEVTDHTCVKDTSTTIYAVDCRIKVPNIFSPNGDGKNEKFVVKNLENYPGSKLIIYNRWGNEIYQNADYKNDWQAPGVSDGTYYFVLYVSDGRDAIPGFVTILR